MDTKKKHTLNGTASLQLSATNSSSEDEEDAGLDKNESIRSVSNAPISPTSADTLLQHIESLIDDHLDKSNNNEDINMYAQHLKKMSSKLMKRKQRVAKICENSETLALKNQDLPVFPPTQTTRKKYGAILSSDIASHPAYRIDPTKYCKLLEGSIRQDWNSVELDNDEKNWDELKPSWTVIFFDLMFVAAIIHISSEVVNAYDYSPNYLIFLIRAFAQFGILSICWIEQNLYESRFKMDQTGDHILIFIYTALVLMMGLGIQDDQLSNRGFLVAYIFAKTVCGLMFVKSSLIPRAFNHSIFMLLEKVITIITTICVLIFIDIDSAEDYQYASWVYLIIFSSLFVYSYIHIIGIVYFDCIRHLGINIPINIPHISERMGAFILIILGETIISIMIQHFEADSDSMFIAYSLTLSFYFIVYCLGKLYFESQPTEYELFHHKKIHALSTSIFKARVYSSVHFLLFFSLLGLGLSSKIITHELNHYDTHSPELVFFPGLSCIFAIISINIIKLTHPFSYKPFKTSKIIIVWTVRFICCGLMFGLMFTWSMIHHVYILIVYVICFAIQISIDFESRQRINVSKQHHKQKSLSKADSQSKRSIQNQHSLSGLF